MASMNASSKGFWFASCCAFIIMPMPRICSWLISMGTFEVPNSSCLMDLSSSISACWLEMMFRESWTISSCSAFLRATSAIAIAPWWWGDHRVDKAPVGVLAVLHDHLLGHSTRAHAHRAVAHLAMIHPGHPAGSAILLPTAGTPACSQDEGYR